MIADQTELFRSLKDAEDWLAAQGFRLQPNSCDWRNPVGDDAGCYVNLRGPYDTVEGFRVEIKRRDQEVVPDERGEALPSRTRGVTAGRSRKIRMARTRDLSLTQGDQAAADG